ncbi:MAG: tRNA (adenosine(37)-N6)-threonylcarbamoyltransferase complex transferase subunit TsaD [Candidatus Hydrogenedentota bacterium]|nr:MAG: tRNA (adenosine(37)-N6)-threonylcarbamoyltransferase complex transferase subunit TsaD [Candidatus Hydrogenedentota bacterium]
MRSIAGFNWANKRITRKAKETRLIGLGIESSCDETSVAIVKDASTVLAEATFSQIALHKPYAGVVPEIASRAHQEKFPYLLQEVFQKAEVSLYSLDYVAVTMRPGLVGSLLTGFITGKTIAELSGAKLIPIHHLEAHFYAILLNGHKIQYPFLGFLISGGNTALYRMDALGKMNLIGDTMDDAAGEALDKAASLLHLPYPGGPSIEQIAKQAKGKQKKKNPFPRPLHTHQNEIRFSYSGLKTALLYHLQKNPIKNEQEKAEIAFYFQQRLIEHLSNNLEKAIVQNPDLNLVIAAGGVTANQEIRKQFQEICTKYNKTLLIPALKYCTDNAAMIAALGGMYYKENMFPVAEAVSSQKGMFPLEEVTP